LFLRIVSAYPIVSAHYFRPPIVSIVSAHASASAHYTARRVSIVSARRV